MSHNLEQTVLRNVITNEPFMRRVLPFLKTKYFQGNYRILFRQLCKYVEKYNRLPTQEAIAIELEKSEVASSDRYSDIVALLPGVFQKEKVDQDWLYDRTEEWCQERAIHLAIMESIDIIDGNSEKFTKGAIPDLLTQALAVGFDANIGHNYFDDVADRFAAYHTEEEKIPFDLDLMNKITGGGIVKKTLSILLAGTGVGKSLAMCHMAAANLLDGKNVLYITMEMSEDKIAERIDANLLDVPINQLEDMPEDAFIDRVSKVKKKTSGNLIIKEYPTAQAHSGHFRALLNELKLKKQFVPDVIYIDYLNICASSRLKGMGGSINSYSYIKSIAEEVRGLAVEFSAAVVSATQVNRTGFTNSDPGLEDTSESFGLPATADFMVALVSNEDLERDGMIMVKQLKNRYNDLNKYKRFMLGINRSHMRLFDAETEPGDIIAETSQTEEIEFEAPGTRGYRNNLAKFDSIVVD